MKLTDTQIKRIKSNTKQYKVGDGGGLFLWVTPSGGKIWRWAYRHEGRAKLMTFGKYPDVPLALARERHGEARKLLATGTDPMAERKAEKAAAEDSFQSVASLWLEHWQDRKSPRHVAYVKRRLDAVLEPTKQAVLDTKKMLDEARITEQRAALCDAAGQGVRRVDRDKGRHQNLKSVQPCSTEDVWYSDRRRAGRILNECDSG